MIPGVEGDVGGMVPVQGEGSADGHEWYFRARDSAWSFHVAVAGESDAVGAGDSYPGWYHCASYGSRNAGHMDNAEAWGFINASISAWRLGRLEYFDGVLAPLTEAELDARCERARDDVCRALKAKFGVSLIDPADEAVGEELARLRDSIRKYRDMRVADLAVRFPGGVSEAQALTTEAALRREEATRDFLAAHSERLLQIGWGGAYDFDVFARDAIERYREAVHLTRGKR
ncbi:MAG: hypothetical protein HOW73_43345 [Polyangiaceae bacterium]|nr:hypothetical protein [Polyangiaceae bacterium]